MSTATSIRAFVRLARPLNAAICMAGVLCGALVAGRPLDIAGQWLRTLLAGEVSPVMARVVAAALSASLILGAGNAFNDVRDLEADRINAPHRPVASGSVSRSAALLFAAIAAFTGVLFSLFLGPPGVAAAVLAAVLLALYDTHLKGVPLAGNVAVAFLGGLAVAYGGIAAGETGRAMLPAAYAVLLHLGRELVKDIEDTEGDAAAGITSTAVGWGPRRTGIVAAWVFIILAPALAAPFAAGVFGPGYLLIVTAGVVPALLYGTWAAVSKPDGRRMHRASALLKAAMPAGMLAVLAGYQGW